ncbi:MAG: condensation domain-containing protein, partial [Roseateles sp.]
VVARHEVLRTTFITDDDGEPLQVIAAATLIDLQHEDLTSLDASEREEVLQRRMIDCARRPFDLTVGPLLRTTLYELDKDDHVLDLTIHHIVTDGWSFGVFAHEFGELYAAFVEDRASSLPELTLQYADFAHWQRQWLQGEVLDTQLGYWNEQLGGEPPVLQLPTDRPRPPFQTGNGASEPYRIEGRLLQELRALSRDHGVTLFMTLMAALKALFQRYSGQSVITVGTPVANRTRLETEGLIGLFVNSLVLSTELSGEMRFDELLPRMKEASLGAYAHQDLPFEQLVELLQPKRDLSRHPLFQVMFALQNAPFEPLELPGLNLIPISTEQGASQFDLTLYVWETDTGLELMAEYNTDLFDRETIVRMLGHYETLLGGVVADAGCAIGELPLMSEAERRQIAAWNTTAVPYPQAATLPGLFAAQAARTPEAVAVRFGEETLSYGELDARSSQLARHLQSLGVARETLVGVALERSAALVVGLLGILKAGGAYVPLDPTFPEERLAFMLADAEVPVLLTEECLREVLPEHQAQVVSLDGDWERIATQPDASFETPAGAADLAYVIYTSGSTGQPKGVQIPHTAVVNFLTAMQRKPGLDSADVLLSVTTLSFDISVLEIFLPLSVGAELVLVSGEEAADGEALQRRLEETATTVMQGTPTTWRLLIESGWQGHDGFKALCGGEAWPRELAEALSERCASVWNMYGPTETTMWSAVGEVSDGEGPVLIGAPIANT